MRLKKGDTVIVLSGRDRGKSGKITTVLPKTAQVIIDGLNKVVRHQKSAKVRIASGRFDKFLPLSVSKVALQNPSKPGKATRIGYKTDAKGRKVRVAKSNGKEI